MNEIERSVWEIHEKRLNENEGRFNAATKDFTEVKEAIRQLTERINEGISKTQQKILDKDQTIELAVHDLRHAFELNSVNMNTKIDNVQVGLLERIEPLERSAEKKDKFWWLVLGAMVLVAITVMGTRVIDKLWPKESAAPVAVETLKARPVR